MHYYFVSTSLPALTFGEKPDITFREVMRLYEANLPPGDLAQVKVVRGLTDIYNLAALWQGESTDRRGNLSQAQLEEALTSGVGLPDYVMAFLEEYEGNDRLRFHGKLVEEFFKRELAASSGFLHEFLQLERELRLVLVGLRAKELGRDVAVELQWEEPHDEIVAQILAQKDAKTFEPPNGYEPLKAIFEEHKTEPMDLQRALLSFRFDRIDQMMVNELFSLGYLLGYLIQLMIIERLEEVQ